MNSHAGAMGTREIGDIVVLGGFGDSYAVDIVSVSDNLFWGGALD